MTRDGTHFTKAYFLSSQGKKKPMERKSRGRSQRVSMGIPENRGKLRTSGNRVRRPGSSSGDRVRRPGATGSPGGLRTLSWLKAWIGEGVSNPERSTFLIPKKC